MASSSPSNSIFDEPPAGDILLPYDWQDLYYERRKAFLADLSLDTSGYAQSYYGRRKAFLADPSLYCIDGCPSAYYQRKACLARLLNSKNDRPYLPRLPKDYKPYLSTLDDGKSFSLIHPVSTYTQKKNTIIQSSNFSLGDSLQSYLSKTVLEWEAGVPKTNIWRTILAWATCKRDILERQRNHDDLLEWENSWIWQTSFYFKSIELKTSLEDEIQALKLILDWVRRGGMEALERAENVMDERRVKPTDIQEHIKQLLELMEQQYWSSPFPTSPYTDGPVMIMSPPLCKEIFKTMLEEIPKLIGMHQRFGLRNFTIEARFSTTFDKILRLSSWTPSSTRNKHLHELLKNALLTLKNLRGNEEYHENLRDVMKQHAAFCAFSLDNAGLITTEDSETTAELCKNLRRLAQNLRKIASTKAEQYQKLYEIFIAHKDDLSHWLDSASPGQGRSLVDSFTSSLKEMASSMRQEADFWKSQSNQFHKWPDIIQTYGCAVDAMPPFPSEELNDDRYSTTPSIHGSVTQNAEPEPQRVPQAAQRVLATFTDLQKLRVNTTQGYLAKSENSISKRMRETRGYLEFVVDVAEKQPSQPSEPKVIVRLAEKALGITKRWNKLHRKVKYWGSFLSIFSKPLACQTFDMVSGISEDDFRYRVIASPDKLIHPYLIELEICLWDMWHHFGSRTVFWERIDSDPATLTLTY